MTDRLGQQLGNYQLVRLLGEGGFAEVYLGEHIHLGTQSAIKVLHTQLTSNDVNTFRTEARMIAHLIHPHIVRVLEFGVDGKTPFLVMDYAPNGTLRQRHPKGTILPLSLIVSYVKQAADALQYAHDEKLIHRDIKPENMLLGRRNEILLSDFGIALVAQSSRYQSAQEMAGTMAYMAPEQIQGKSRPASDQYSLGIIVYEWLSGDRPFHGSLTELVGQHLSVAPPSLQKKGSTLSSEVDQIVLTALAKDPKQRFASVQVFATALEQASQFVQSYPPRSSVVVQSPQLKAGVPSTKQLTSPTNTDETLVPDPLSSPTNIVIPQSQLPQSTNTITPPGQLLLPTVAVTPTYTPVVFSPSRVEAIPSGTTQLSTRRVSRRAMMAGLAGVGVIGGGIAWLVHAQRLLVSSLASRTSAPSSTSLGTILHTYHGLSGAVYAVPWSPDGIHIAAGGYDKTVQVWNVADGKHIYTYHGHSDGIWTVAWSSDGKRIASGSDLIGGNSGDQTVQVWDASDGGNVYTYFGHTGGVRSIAWSPNGKRVASGSDDKTVQVWNANDGSNVYTYRGHSGAVYAVAWSPDGTHIASGSDDGTVQVWSSTTGNTSFTYTGHAGFVLAMAWSPDGRYIASGAADQTVQVWNAMNGNHIYTYLGHVNAIHGVAWSPNSKRIASVAGDFGGVADHTVQVWDAINGRNVYIYRGDPDLVYAVAWSPDGTRIASGGENLLVQVWQAI